MCGIAGIINKKKRDFDYPTFTALGVVNDERGGDSCGIFIDGKSAYGVDSDQAYFRCFFYRNKLLGETSKAQVALLHCRKASVGGISLATAQPVIIKNDKGKVDFVLVHNGTLYNYEELARKYIPNIKTSGMTDSQILAHIFYHTGFDCLSEYDGGAAFVAVDYRGGAPVTYIFKGASKKTIYAKEIEIERPLYYAIDPELGEFTFSSIFHILESQRAYLTVRYVPSNKLLCFDQNTAGDELTVLKEIDRSSCSQSRRVVSTYTSPKTQTQTVVYPVKPASTSTTQTQPSTKTPTPTKPGDTTSSFTPAQADVKYLNPSTLCRQLGASATLGFVVYNDSTDAFMFMSRRVHHPSLALTKTGEAFDTDKADTVRVAFFDGIPMKSPECFEKLEEMRRAFDVSPSEFNAAYPFIVRYLSLCPYGIENGDCYDYSNLDEPKLFTGSIKRILDNATYIYKDGKQAGPIVRVQQHSDLKAIIAENAKIHIDFNQVKLHVGI